MSCDSFDGFELEVQFGSLNASGHYREKTTSRLILLNSLRSRYIPCPGTSVLLLSGVSNSEMICLMICQCPIVTLIDCRILSRLCLYPSIFFPFGIMLAIIDKSGVASNLV